MDAVVLTLAKARTELGTNTLERHIAHALSLPAFNVSALIDGEDYATIVVYGRSSELDANNVAAKINAAIQRNEAAAWTTGRDATCHVADDEESVSIGEEEALDMWRGMSEEDRTGHLGRVPDPDGAMIQPTHDEGTFSAESTGIGFVSPTESQLRRDPSLLEFDNVRRVHASQTHTISWNEPIIITNAIPDEILANSEILDKNRLSSVYGGAEVRTGNRETLIDNGFTNSKPLQLSEVFAVPRGRVESGVGCGRIVFSPVRELPDDFVDELGQFTACFPRPTEEFSTMKFTLTLASEGFGIGMHKHNAAMFMLLLGEKKWYMNSGGDLEGDSETHPGFYREKSSHKCILRRGEILFVPHEWYHEIFNLGEYTAGIQALPE
jgi:hypothetical protein